MRNLLRGAGFTVDLAIAVATAGLGLLLVSSLHSAGSLEVNLHVAQAVEVVASATLLFRRRFPAVILGICIALSFITPVPAAVVALHATGRYTTHRTVSFVCVLGSILVVGPVWAISSTSRGISEFLLFATLALAPWLIGQGERSAVELRTQQSLAAYRELQQLVDHARDSERIRLAREMHDVVAHRISFIVLQANLLDMKTEDPVVREDSERIRAAGREALDEMREILGMLRRSDLDVTTETAPDLERHSLTGLAIILDEARAVGQPVSVDLDLIPRQIPDQAERTVFRVVRESLTNAVRHAPRAPTTVRITEAQEGIRVTVTNERPADPPTGLTSGGNGLRGLRERIGLVGGSISAGPTPSRGFQVTAVIPRGAP